MQKTVVTFLVSYDAEYLKTSLPIVYDHVDKIVLALDHERRTWKGNKFELPSDFFAWVKQVDSDRKIELYEDTFFLPGKDPLVLDSRQRQMAAEYAGMDDTWHIQVDADEYVLNFPVLLEGLRKQEMARKDCSGLLFMGKWISLFKQDEKGFFYIDNGEAYELCALAAYNPKYVAARKTVFRERVVLDVYIVHQTFARDAGELSRKLTNWGHSDVFDASSYLKMWDAVDRNNCRYLANFNPSYPAGWKRLQYLEAESIAGFIEKISRVLESRAESRDDGRTRNNGNPVGKFLRRVKRAASSRLSRVWGLNA